MIAQPAGQNRLNYPMIPRRKTRIHFSASQVARTRRSEAAASTRRRSTQRRSKQRRLGLAAPPFLTGQLGELQIQQIIRLVSIAQSSNAASKARRLGWKSSCLVNWQASAAPHSRSIPESSHSMDRGPS